MPCESCAVQFSVFKRKRACLECERYYCAACLRRGGSGGTICAPCRVLSTRPLSRPAVAHLRVRDLQCFLQRQNVSTRGCVEREDLVSLVVGHVNSAAFRRRAPRTPPGPFSSLKGFTTNINELLNSAFDLRPTQPAHPAPAPSPNSNCYNAAHDHSASTTRTNTEQHPAPSRAEPNLRAAPPEAHVYTEPSSEVVAPAQASEAEGPLVDSADCFEIEDVDDSDWELVRRVARPLPDDCTVLLTENDSESSGSTPQRADSEPELRRAESADTDTDTASLKDEAAMEGAPRRVNLDELAAADDLEALSARQLKELLAVNRVDYRGCLERADLLLRARTLWADHAKYACEPDKLPLEESCKICMAAPLECVLLECGHIAACTSCSKQLAECPICRQYVVRVVRFFRS